MKLTKAQQRALLRKWKQNPITPYTTFRRNIVNYGEYIMVAWCGMVLGIEKCGHVHS